MFSKVLTDGSCYDTRTGGGRVSRGVKMSADGTIGTGSSFWVWLDFEG